MSNTSIAILVNGKACKQYTHEGRIFIEAKAGSEYEIQLSNYYGRRMLFVTSVDGLDVLTGKPAAADGGGYIVEAYNNVKIKGFRVSNDDVGAFKFTSKENSYAANTAGGNPNNTGVIGVLAYYEKENYPTYIAANASMFIRSSSYNGGGIYTAGVSDNYLSYNAAAQNYSKELVTDAPRSINNVSSHAVRLCSTDPTPPLEFDMGTAWGSKKTSKIVETEFKTGQLAWSSNVYYASREQLVKMGVRLDNVNNVAFPEPFPVRKFATPPAGWP